MVQTLDEAQKDATSSARKLIDAVHSLEPLPEYKEGEEQAFLNAMLEGKRQETLSRFVKNVDFELAMHKKAVEDLKVAMDDFIPEHKLLEQQLNKLLRIGCITTCARILLSKAAKTKKNALVDSIQKTLEFGENLDLPKCLQKSMQELMDRIVKASRPDNSERKRSRSRERGA